MKKPLWSISTTVRNPERLVGFLRVLRQLEGVDFSTDTQMRYQILLIKERLYSPSKIPSKYRELFTNVAEIIPYKVAEEVFHYQNYRDPPMRGRQSVNPLNKLGFAIARAGSGRIQITELGNKFLASGYDISFPFLN